MDSKIFWTYIQLSKFQISVRPRSLQKCSFHHLKCKKHNLQPKTIILRWRSSEASKQPSKPIEGIPYNKLTIGVPKESWKNEKRYIKLLYKLKNNN